MTGDDAPTMVGGQAVNLWCLIAGKDDPAVAAELAPFRPFTSKDCDVLGDARLLLELGKRKQLRVRKYPPGQASNCVGYLYEPDDPDREPVIEVLSGICGLPRNEMADPIQVRLDDNKVFRVLNPVDLLRAKLANVAQIPQEGRQDLRHVKMLVPCVRWYVSHVHQEVVSGKSADRKLIMRLLRKCIGIINSPHGRGVGESHGVDLRVCFPWDLLRGPQLILYGISRTQTSVRHQRDNLGSADAMAHGTGRRLLPFDPGFDDTLMGKLESLRI